MSKRKSTSWNGYSVGDSVSYTTLAGETRTGRVVKIADVKGPYALEVMPDGGMYRDFVTSEQVVRSC